MKYLKTYLKIIMAIIIGTIVIVTLSYLNIISENTFKVLKKGIILLILLIEGINLGKKIKKNGYIEGIKLGGIVSLTFLVIGLLINKGITIEKIIFYITMIVITTIGSIIGVNKKIKAK